MPDDSKTPVWLAEIRDSLSESLKGMLAGAQELVPKLVAMLLILVVGYLIALCLRWIATSILRRVGFDVVCKQIGLTEVLGSIGLKLAPSMVMAKLIFWGLMMIFMKAALDVLGLESISDSFDSLIGYIPNVIAAMVIVIGGLMLGNLVKAMAVGAAERFGIEYGPALGQLVYGAILVMVGTVAVSQLQLQTQLVDRFLEIGMMAIGAALALALGFGTRDTARHVVAGVYLRESYPPGTNVMIEKSAGTVAAVQTVNTQIATEKGNIFVPNAKLIEMIVREDESK